MKQFPLIIVALGLLFLCNRCASPGREVHSLDFSGVDQFLKIAASLEKDKDPDTADWEVLFDTPGYAALTQSEFNREFFRENFSLVFMPSLQEELEQRLDEEKERPAHFRFLHHYLDAKQRREAMAEYADSLRANAGTLLEESAQKAKQYLPPIQADDYIPVSFVVFASDARGYTPVVIDILFAMDMGESLHYLIAHELHHFYRNKILVFDRDLIREADADIMWVLDQIHAEGLADQTDKRILISDKEGPMHGLADRWEEMVANAPEYVKHMNEYLAAVAAGTEEKQEAGARLRETLPMSGHPVGFFMTNLIIRELGRESVIKHAGDPFAFFHLYNEAAGRTAGEVPALSPEAMAVIDELEGRYVNN